MPGGQGGSQTSTQQVNTTTDMGPWKEQGPFLKKGFAAAGDLLDKTSPSYYPGFTTAQPNNWQNTGLEDMARVGAKFGTGNLLNASANKTAQDTIQGNFLDPSTNPWLKKTFAAGADDVTRAYQTATAPQTAANFTGLGRYGAPAYRRERESNERTLGTTLDNLATSIYGGNYQQERNRQLAQTNSVGNVIGANFLGPGVMVSAGGQRQAIDQPNVADAVNRWNVEKNPAAQWEELAKYMALVGNGNWGQSGTTSSFSTKTEPGRQGGDPFSMALGGLLSAGSLAGQLGWAPFAAGGAAAATPTMLAGGGAGSLAALPFLSDVRAKEDISPVGKTFDGQNLYAYRYKGSAIPQIGLMAQEVEQRDPGAVIEGADGFKRVDYARALHGAGWRPFG